MDTLRRQAQTRTPELVPIRHGRMLTSPFAFFRGGAAIMAADLAGTPVTGLRAQLCGDAHLANFGAFAAPDRSLVFDLNDFDETLLGPWEWDSSASPPASLWSAAIAGSRVTPAVIRSWRRFARTGKRCGVSLQCGRSTSGTRG